MPRNNQLLHFAFREDKQWKLQQVTGPLPSQGSGHKGRQWHALAALRPPGAGGHGDLQPQQAREVVSQQRSWSRLDRRCLGLQSLAWCEVEHLSCL